MKTQIIIKDLKLDQTQKGEAGTFRLYLGNAKDEITFQLPKDPKAKEALNIIQEGFQAMQTKEDLLVLLNLANKFLYGDKAMIFKLNQLTYFANSKWAGERYKAFQIAKKSGGKRTIHAPVKGLKQIQETLAYILQGVYEPHKAAYGFVWEKSVVDNAKVHVGQNYVLNLDLKDFFPSIDQARVWKCLQLKPFYLNKNEGSSNPFLSFKSFKTDILKLNENETFEIGFAKHVGFGYINIANEKAHLDGPLGADIFAKQGEHYVVKIRISRELFEKHKIEKLNLVVYTISNPDYFNNAEEPKRLCVIDDEANFKNDGRLKLANLIASLCFTEMEVERMGYEGEWQMIIKSVLPQGAPTSPVLSNVICQRLDFLLSGVAKRFGLRYTRYADDLTFSSMHNVYQPEGEFMNELKRIIAEQGFHIKEGKTRLQKSGYRQEVTGLIVNEQVNVQKRYLKKIRQWLYLWERYGYEKAQSCFLNDYYKDKPKQEKSLPQLENVLLGKLAYLSMVKGKENNTSLKLKERFEKLSFNDSKIKQILAIWEKEGIEKAMEKYYGTPKINPDLKADKSNNSIANKLNDEFDISIDDIPEMIDEIDWDDIKDSDGTEISIIELDTPLGHISDESTIEDHEVLTENLTEEDAEYLNQITFPELPDGRYLIKVISFDGAVSFEKLKKKNGLFIGEQNKIYNSGLYSDKNFDTYNFFAEMGDSPTKVIVGYMPSIEEINVADNKGIEESGFSENHNQTMKGKDRTDKTIITMDLIRKYGGVRARKFNTSKKKFDEHQNDSDEHSSDANDDASITPKSD